MNILESIDNALVEIKYKTISQIIDNKIKCAEYISDALEKNGLLVPATTNRVKEILDYRIKHVLLTFGLGVLFSKFGSLREDIESVYKVYTKKYRERNGKKIPFVDIWLAVCLYHDYGYFIFEDFMSCDTLDKVKVDHSIFLENFKDLLFKASQKEKSPIKSRYSKQLYEEYYRVSYLRNNENLERKTYELGDHGILGGYVLFNRLCNLENKSFSLESVNKTRDYRSMKYSDLLKIDRHLIPFYRDICFRIMEHNIWKGTEEFYKKWNTDIAKISEILDDSFILISKNEPLLYLLSMVDTVEYIKFFCTYSDSKSQDKKSIWPSTVSKQISVVINDFEISLSFEGLDSILKIRESTLTSKKWVDSVLNLPSWLDIEVTLEKNCINIKNSL